MKLVCLCIMVFLTSCIGGSLYVENPVSATMLNSNNFVRTDIEGQITDTLLISFDHSVNDKPVFFDNQMFLLTSSGHTFIYEKDSVYHDIIEKSAMRLNQGSNVGPVLYKNFVLFAFGSGRENLQLYDLKSSSFVWKIRIPFGIDSQPIIINDYIYVASLNGLIIKLFLGDASEQWRYNTKSNITADINISGNLIFAATNESKLFAIDADNGSLKWQREISEQASYSQPLIVENKVIVSSVAGDVRAYNKNDGSDLWHQQVDGSIYGNMSADNDHIYFGTNADYLYKLNLLGNEIWKFQSKGIVNAQALIGEKNIYFGSGSGYFYILNKTDATLLWSKQYEGRIISSPVFWQNKLIVFSDNDNIYELRSF